VKKSRLYLFVFLFLFIGSTMVLAGSPHFIGSLSITFGSLHVSGDLAGLGNTNVTVQLVAYANVTVQCQNRGGNTAPGRNPVAVSTSVTTSTTPDSNGRASISLIAQDPLTVSPLPPSPSPKTAGCPNGNWTVNGFVPGSTLWTRAQISVIDNATNAVLLQENYACTGTGAALTCTKI
jgi:hypothetical protein